MGVKNTLSNPGEVRMTMEYLLMDTDGIICLVNQIGCSLGGTFYISDECQDGLEQLLILLKNENKSTLQVGRMLSLLKVMENTIVPLVVQLGSGELDEDEADSIFSLTCKLMVQLTLPEETLVYTNRFKLPANVEMEKYKADLKRAAVDTVFLTAFLKQIKSLIGKAEKALSDVIYETINNGLLYIRNVIFIPISNNRSDVSQLCVDLILQQHLFQAGLNDIILSLGKMEHHFYWHSALIQIISLLYNDQNLNDDNRSESFTRTASTIDSDEVRETETSGSTYHSEEDQMSIPYTQKNPRLSPGNPCSPDANPAGESSGCEKAWVPPLVGTPPNVNLLTERIIEFETRLCLTYNELEVRQSLIVLSESLIKEGVFNNLVKALVTSNITSGENALSDLYLSWFISYFLRCTQSLEVKPSLIKCCLSVEVVSYLTHVGVLTCEEVIANGRCGKTEHLVQDRNHLTIQALQSILSALDHYVRMELNPTEERFIENVVSVILQLQDLRYLFLLCIRNFDPARQDMAYLRNFVIINHKYLLLAENTVQYKNVALKFDILEHLKNFASVDIMAQYGLLLQHYATESPTTLDCIFTMMHHVSGECMSLHTLFQYPILQTFSAILESNIEINEEASNLIHFLFRKFLNFAESSPHECASVIYQQSGREVAENAEPLEKRRELQEPSSSRMEWCQEDVDELFVAFEKNSTLPVEELLRCITQDISDKNIHKSEQEVLNQLVEQALVQEKDVGDLREASVPSPPPSLDNGEAMDMEECQRGEPNWWHGLIETLRSRGDSKRLSLLQNIFLEVCYVKIGGRNVGKFQQPEEPVALHCTIQNKPVPLVPFLSKFEKSLDDFIFCLTLEKLGVVSPQDPTQVFPRIPANWSPQKLLSTAKLLGPINFDEVKFSEADVNECVFKMETEDHPDLQSSSGKPPKENKRTNGQLSNLWDMFIQQCNITMRKNPRDGKAIANGHN